MNCDDARILMMKMVDGLLSEQEEPLLDEHLDHCDRCRSELGDYMAQKEATDLIRQRLEYDEALDSYWGGIHNRLEQHVGVALVIIGTAILSGFGAVHLLIEPDVPLWIRIGSGSLGAGFLILLASVIRWRLTTRKKDKYTEVVR